MKEVFPGWDGTPKGAIELQKALREKVVIQPFSKQIKYIGGADVSLNRFSDILYAGIIVLSFPDLQPVAHSLVKTTTKFPYIPGLLSFREVPGLVEAWEKLILKPDLLVVDGQGIAHSRRLGIAAHLGVTLDIPTIGSAKSILYGKIQGIVNGTEIPVGSALPLIDPKTDEQIGAALYSKKRSKPLIVSPGYKVSVDESVSTIKSCIRGYRLPEPTRLAHELVNAFRRGEIS
jgi:deoxyribonuclease V